MHMNVQISNGAFHPVVVHYVFDVRLNLNFGLPQLAYQFWFAKLSLPISNLSLQANFGNTKLANQDWRANFKSGRLYSSLSRRVGIFLKSRAHEAFTFENWRANL